MKKILLPLILLILGFVLGGGAAFGVSQVMGPPPAPGEHGEGHMEEEEVETVFVPAGTILVPVVAQDGYLSGYVNFEVELEVAVDKAENVTAKLPLLLHAINLRAFRTPIAAGQDYILPDLKLFAKMVEEAAEESLGKDELIQAMVISAKPV